MTSAETIVRLVNHACVLLEVGAAKLLCDPWITGSCFNNGWDLIVDNDFSISDLDFTHIWISHEHPDHFSPKDLQELPPERRSKTTIFYQETTDKKVMKFCQKLGYKVVELPDFQKVAVNSELSITCAKSRGSDSWLLFETPTAKILNINDCFVKNPAELEKIKNCAGEVDVLLSQYSFANWVGNIDDTQSQKAIAEMYLELFVNQVDFFKPRAVIPFANFTWYSNEENAYLNKYATKVSSAVDRLRNSKSIPIVLKPGDAYVVGKQHQNDSALKFWENAYKELDTKNRRVSRFIDLSSIFTAFGLYQSRLKHKNDWWAVLMTQNAGHLPPCHIYLTDHKQALKFDICESLEMATVSEEECSIAMSSDSLNFLLSHEWGRGTLQINGRFQANYQKLIYFIRQTQIAFANNIGLVYPATLSPNSVINPNSFILRVAEGNAKQHL